MSKIKGDFGESHVVQYMTDRGYVILARNYRCIDGEIDIIASDEEYLIFCEVKLRKQNSITIPIEAINRNKQNRIIKTAQNYIDKHCSNHEIQELQPRFDISCIEIGGNKKITITDFMYIENAFCN